MYLEEVSNQLPAGAESLLLELGDGENGFGGTSFGNGTATLAGCLQSLQDCQDPAKVPPEFVPQTVFWMIDNHQVVGMMRVRHMLNDRLIRSGGHVGYYVRASQRGTGYATAALGMAVAFLKAKGVDRVLVTTDPGNEISARVARACGGVQDTPGTHPVTGTPMMRFWIQS